MDVEDRKKLELEIKKLRKQIDLWKNMIDETEEKTALFQRLLDTTYRGKR